MSADLRGLLARLREFVVSIYDLRLACRSCGDGDDLKCNRCGDPLSSTPVNVCDYYGMEDLRDAIDVALRAPDEGAPPAPAPATEVEKDRDDLRALLDWLDERVGDATGVVSLGMTDNGGVGCWLPRDGDGEVPEGESVEEAIAFRKEKAERAERGEVSP